MKTLKMQNHWYLGLIGLVGLWKFPHIWHFFVGQSGNYWDLANLLWFLWFLYLIPEERNEVGQ
jgi:hypothetical protein